MSRIGKGEWILLYIVAGIIDISQWILDATIYGAAVNEVINPIIGAALAVYFQLRGVSMIKHISRFLSLVGGTALEELSASIAPAWIIDVWYIHKTVRQEETQVQAAKAEAEFTEAAAIQPLYANGVGRVRNNANSGTSAEFNRGGRARARGNISAPAGTPSLGEVTDNEEEALSA